MNLGYTYINTNEKSWMSYFSNMSRPLRHDDFTLDLTQREKFIGTFYISC